MWPDNPQPSRSTECEGSRAKGPGLLLHGRPGGRQERLVRRLAGCWEACLSFRDTLRSAPDSKPRTQGHDRRRLSTHCTVPEQRHAYTVARWRNHTLTLLTRNTVPNVSCTVVSETVGRCRRPPLHRLSTYPWHLFLSQEHGFNDGIFSSDGFFVSVFWWLRVPCFFPVVFPSSPSSSLPFCTVRAVHQTGTGSMSELRVRRERTGRVIRSLGGSIWSSHSTFRHL